MTYAISDSSQSNAYTQQLYVNILPHELCLNSRLSDSKIIDRPGQGPGQGQVELRLKVVTKILHSSWRFTHPHYVGKIRRCPYWESVVHINYQYREAEGQLYCAVSGPRDALHYLPPGLALPCPGRPVHSITNLKTGVNLRLLPKESSMLQAPVVQAWH